MSWDEITQHGGSKLAGLAVENGQVFVASSGSGEIMIVPGDDEDSGRGLIPTLFTGGVPSGLAFDRDGAIFVADFAFKCILSKGADAPESDWVPVVADYEGKQFYGPNSLCFSANGTLFFTDSGPMGDTSLSSPKGSVFCVSREDRLLKPIVLECLAHPSGIVANDDGSVVYVSETMANRILRLVRRSNDIYHCSVFRTFDGGLGPTALAMDSKNRLFVARYDFAELRATGNAKGSICILDEKGNIEGSEIQGPGPEILGMAIAPGSDRSETLFVSEQHTGRVYAMHLASIEAEQQ